jgi:hypothetical protein
LPCEHWIYTCCFENFGYYLDTCGAILLYEHCSIISSTTLLKGHYYIAEEAVLHCWGGSTTCGAILLYEHWSIISSTTLLKRQYYIAEEAVLDCWRGSTTLLKRQYYTAEEAVLHCWRLTVIVVCWTRVQELCGGLNCVLVRQWGNLVWIIYRIFIGYLYELHGHKGLGGMLNI